MKSIVNNETGVETWIKSKVGGNYTCCSSPISRRAFKISPVAFYKRILLQNLEVG